MSAPAAAASPAPEKPKSKLKLILLGTLVVILATGGAGGAWFFLNKKGHEGGQEHESKSDARRAAPVYMALENMVVNLADPGGERVAQVGITLDLDNDKTVDKVKAVLPSIRSNVLMLVSQRSSGELLKRDGKEKLASDIAAEVSRSLGFDADDAPLAKKSAKAGEETDEAPVLRKRRSPPSPVHGVLFSSFIVQ